MTERVDLSLSDTTHARAADPPCHSDTIVSGRVDPVLRAKLTRLELADHLAMLDEAGDGDRLRVRAHSRRDALSAWRTGR